MSKAIRITIKSNVIIEVLILTITRVVWTSSLRGRRRGRLLLFNMFNAGDSIVDVAHQLSKLLFHVRALISKKLCKLGLGHTLIEIYRGLQIIFSRS